MTATKTFMKIINRLLSIHKIDAFINASCLYASDELPGVSDSFVIIISSLASSSLIGANVPPGGKGSSRDGSPGPNILVAPFVSPIVGLNADIGAFVSGTLDILPNFCNDILFPPSSATLIFLHLSLNNNTNTNTTIHRTNTDIIAIINAESLVSIPATDDPLSVFVGDSEGISVVTSFTEIDGFIVGDDVSTDVTFGIGILLGYIVGFTLGLLLTLVGVIVGVILGYLVGGILGYILGDLVVVILGALVGVLVGVVVGAFVGVLLGLLVGIIVGLILGYAVGDSTGDLVGDSVGGTLGVKLGAFVGVFVGVSVGNIVGEFVHLV
eukprot:CAMPEP_0114656444 /NCGR_PEP_ID=MMETSP0191-20121206/12358_1 /TAXON_ID=126664 /ORGANISM="Sorites sp." /LENGTH=324 /DNA_ID=CAMNT_0001873681 /DNA_START=408 /DNA_END=1383 /DNA_ORIENTATION=-